MSAPNRSLDQGKSPSAEKQSPLKETTEDTGAQQLVAAVDDLLDQLQSRFEAVSTDIFSKMDNMAQRIDELEKSVTAARESNKKG
ncbi:hypothetical protein FQN57_004307 [Myotisia sp. PD_48]|nr:hypothetical protein FQN57_004307 [Myotisia sp. PD_48]